MSNIFNKIQVKKPKSSTHNLSFENKLTAKFGELTPFLCQEILPGDKVKVGEQHLIRLAPTIHPLMQNVNVFFHYFFVPNRLIHSPWENFIAGAEDKNGVVPCPPYFTVSSVATHNDHYLENGSLLDYLGFPTLPVSEVRNYYNIDTKFSSLPFRAYQLIYNDYFRDQNVIADIELDTETSGAEKTSEYDKLLTIRKRSWHKDYFTSALPSPDMGVDVVLPVNGDVPLTYNKDGYTYVKRPYNDSTTGLADIDHIGTDRDMGLYDPVSGSTLTLDNHENLRAKLDGHASMSSIQNLRRAFKMQEFLEKQARTGSRYIEMLMAFFGVKSSDARLQRPEYLAGIKTPIIMSEVQQTSQTSADSALGGLAGNGTSLNSGFCFSRRFEEHGWLIGIMSVMPKASYYQGLNRKFSRLNDRFDYYWPDFQHIGEQEIKNKELYLACKTEGTTSPTSYNEGTFGYAPRYSEYKYNPDEVHGEFRDSLSSWHMARKFANMPYLNRSFLEYDNNNADNVFAVSTDIQAPLYCQIYNNIIMQRKMSKFGNPRL